MPIDSITFGGGAISRAGDQRGNATKLFMQGNALVLVFWRGRPLVDINTQKLVWIAQDTAVLGDMAAPVFLGLKGDVPYFAINLPDWPEVQIAPDTFLDTGTYAHPSLPKSQQFAELRAIMADLSVNDAGDAATAKSILGWHESHQFCANCGAKTLPSMGGWQRDCPACNRKHFPRVDPVVIMLITHGNDVLLGRSPGWPEGMYSLLAGFVEPGETITEAVAREVYEEVGIITAPAQVVADQPWPFPSSLMIGCRAIAKTRAFTIDPVEIEDAIWINREELMLGFAGHNPDLRPVRHGTIARFLLDKWLADRL